MYARTAGAGLQAALQARSYKKEVVVAVHGCTDEPPLLPVNMIGQLKSLGFEHLLMLSAHKVLYVALYPYIHTYAPGPLMIPHF